MGAVIYNTAKTGKDASEIVGKVDFSRKMAHNTVQLVQESEDYLTQNKSKAPASRKATIVGGRAIIGKSMGDPLEANQKLPDYKEVLVIRSFIFAEYGRMKAYPTIKT